MQIELTTKEFRNLLDMVYIGNWVLNSTRGDDRFAVYDDLESKLFALARENGMKVLAQDWENTVVPSRAYTEGGIHEAEIENLALRAQPIRDEAVIAKQPVFQAGKLGPIGLQSRAVQTDPDLFLHKHPSLSMPAFCKEAGLFCP